MRFLFYPPEFPKRERTEQASTVFALVWLFVALALGASIVLVRLGAATHAFTPLLVLLPMGLVILEFNRRGWTRFSSFLFIVTVICLATGRALVSGGIRSPGVTAFYLFALMAGLLLGEQAGIAVAILCGFIGLGLVIAEYRDLLPPQSIHYDSLAFWWINIAYIALTLFLLNRASRSLRRAYESAQTELVERQKAEAAATVVKTQLETLIAEARVGIIVFDDFKAVVANHEMGRILGYNNEIAIGDVPDIRAVFGEEERKRLTCLAEACFSGDIPREPIRLKCPRKDGTWVDLESRSFPIDWNGKRSICSMVTDITQQLQLEERLRQSQKLEAIGQMTGGIAHDFNNLLTVTLANSTFLESKLDQDPALKSVAGLITLASERGTTLTKKLLAFSRRQDLDLRVADINAVIAGVEALLGSALGSNTRIEITPCSAPCLARVDISELENALLNLAVNARDAMPDGGVLTITVDVIHVPAGGQAASELMPQSEHTDFVLISVSDTGIGMNQKVLSQVFDPFFTTKDVGKGSGLGLSMVYGFITQLGGQIRIMSELGLGTTIELYLPQEPHEDIGGSEELLAPDIRGGDERILVVEDDDLIREQVRMQLVSLGYLTVVAKDGVEALSILESDNEFDLLFSDIMMPRGVSGIEVAKRARLINPHLPVLLSSGYVESEAQAGATDLSLDLLPKPYKSHELAGRIRSMLDRQDSL